jgi:hypothetical protein
MLNLQLTQDWYAKMVSLSMKMVKHLMKAFLLRAIALITPMVFIKKD